MVRIPLTWSAAHKFANTINTTEWPDEDRDPTPFEAKYHDAKAKVGEHVTNGIRRFQVHITWKSRRYRPQTVGSR